MLSGKWLSHLRRFSLSNIKTLFASHRETAVSAENALVSQDLTINRTLGREWFISVLLVIVDYLAIVSAIVTAIAVRLQVVPLFLPALPQFELSGSYLFFVLPFIYLMLFFYEHLYYRRLPFWQSAEKLFKACFFATMITTGVMFFSRAADNISRIVVATSGGIAFLYLLISRYFMKQLLVSQGLWQRPVIIVGGSETADILAKAFAAESNLGYEISGLITDDYGKKGKLKYPLLGTLANMERIIGNSGVKEVIIAAPDLDLDKMLKLVYKIRPLVSRVSIVPNLFGVPMSNMELETLVDQETIILRTRSNLASPANRLLKYSLDVVLCLLGLVVFIPVFTVIFLLIYVTSPGPVIFAHRRVGVNGKNFNCLKFRTMALDAEDKLKEYLASDPAAQSEWRRDFKLKNDPRVTPVGKWLRRTSLDELPQIINVLRGEMSLVGPRPIVREEIEKYQECINDYYLVRPGLTGYWQINGRNDVGYGQRVKMDSWYVRNWSVWLDLTLLVKTVKVVIKKTGAY